MSYYRVLVYLLVIALWLPTLAVADEPSLRSLFADVKNLGRPSVTVMFDQPPKHWLQVERVAFVESKGKCVGEVEALLKQHFVDQGVTIVDRSQLETVLQEHGLIRSRLVDPATAIELGKMLGATTMIRLDVQRCDDDHESESVGSSRYVTTFTDVKGSIEIIDIETTRVYSTQVFTGRHEERKRSQSWRPSESEKAAVHDVAIRRAVVDALGLLLPWPDQFRVYLYDTKRCGLKDVSRRFAIGDLDEAYRLAKAAVRECEGENDDLRARTQFILGYSLLALGRAGEAVSVLEEAYLVDPERQILEGLNHAREIFEAKEKLRDYQKFLETSGSTARARLVAKALGDGEAPNDAGEGDGASAKARLEQIEELLEAGLITQREYDEKRAEILDSL